MPLRHRANSLADNVKSAIDVAGLGATGDFVEFA
jgi:hypothetical protein